MAEDNEKKQENNNNKETQRRRPNPNFKMPQSIATPSSHGVLPVRIPKTAGMSGMSAMNNENGKKLVVGKNIKLNGDIDSCESLVVEGQIEANLTSAQMLEIIKGGVFKGSAEVDTAYISGEFDGDLTVKKNLYIYSGGFVKGKIIYADIVIESGGIIKGSFKKLNPSKS